MYRIERINIDTGKPFEDGEHIIYANGNFRDDSEIGRLMHDFNCSDPNEMKIELMRDTARYYKENPKGVTVMCKAMEEMRDETRRSMAMEIARNMINEGKLALEDIARYSMLPMEQVIMLAEAK